MPTQEPQLADSHFAVWSRLRWAAVLSLAVHFAAGLAMAIVLRHGLETNPELSSRLRFVVEHNTAWTLAWLTWHAARVCIVDLVRGIGSWRLWFCNVRERAGRFGHRSVLGQRRARPSHRRLASRSRPRCVKPAASSPTKEQA